MENKIKQLEKKIEQLEKDRELPRLKDKVENLEKYFFEKIIIEFKVDLENCMEKIEKVNQKLARFRSNFQHELDYLDEKIIDFQNKLGRE